MFLTSLDKKLLKKLIRVQSTLPDYVIVISEDQIIYHSCGWSSECVNKSFQYGNKHFVNMKPYEIEYALNHLIESGLVLRDPKHGTSPCLQVSYMGWYHESVCRSNALHLLLTNLFFPALVAFVTALITLMLSGV